MNQTPLKRARVFALWIALALACSPVVAQLCNWASDRAESRYVLWVPILLALQAWQLRHHDSPRRVAAGIALLTCAPLAMLLGLETDSPTLGLGGMAAGFLGVALWTGQPARPFIWLSLWWVPVPYFVLATFSPVLDPQWAAVVAGLSEPMGMDLIRTGAVLSTPEGVRVEFFAPDTGLVLAHGFSLVGAWFAMRRKATLSRSLGWVLGFAIVGFVLQGAVLLAACVRLTTAGAGAAREALVLGPTIMVTLAGILATYGSRVGGKRAQPPEGSGTLLAGASE